MTKTLLRFLTVLSILGSSALARGVQDESPPVDRVGQPAQEGMTREAAKQRIAELEASSDLEESLRTRLLEIYRQIDQRLEARQSYSALTETYRTSIGVAPEERARAQAELAAAKAKPAEDTSLPADATADGLQPLSTQAKAELASLRSQLGELERRLNEQRERPGAMEQQLSEVRTVLQQLDRDLAAPAPDPDAPEIERAARQLLVARQRARVAELAMLDQELLSNPVRVALLEALHDVLLWKVAEAEARVGRLEEWVSQLRKTEAERASQQAERLRRAASGKHPLIVELTSGIAEATRDTQALLERIDEVRAERKAVDERLAATEEDKREIERSLELGITGSLGTVLLEQRRQLAKTRSFRRTGVERSSRATAERLKLFTDERELKILTDPARLLDRIESRLAKVELEGQERDELRTEFETLLATKASHLSQLQKARGDYLAAIGELEAREKALNARAGELAGILDERLLWIPNAPPISGATLGRMRGDVTWLASVSLWQHVGSVLAADYDEHLTGVSLAGLVLLGLWLARRRLRARLESIAAGVGKVRTDSIRLTVQALALQVLHTAPVPAAVLLLGWRLTRAAESTETSKAVGAGLITAATVGFSFQFLRGLCREHGIARAHFRWRKRTVRLVRRNLLWYLWIALPTSFLIALTQEQSDALLRYSLGRLAFIVLMLAASVLAFRMLHPSHGLYIADETRSGSAWLRSTRRAWLPLGLAVPLTLVVLAATGYYYAALQLEYRLNQTILIILSAVFLHAYLLRWLLVSQKRLAMKVAIEKRAAAQKSRESGEGTHELEDMHEGAEEIDVVGIKEQTQDLLRVAIGFFVLVGFWFAWVSVLPALGVLNEVWLWDRTVIVDGVPTLEKITLASLGLALLLVVITVTAARNMPGFLEIALLQRLPLEPGARYATRTLALYAIVSTGIVLAFNAIGVGWSSVQWLVAALTVGLGFGLQEIFANFVSGLIILLERPVRVGDTVTVANVSGVVSRIRMRATTITDWKRRELVVPNKAFITNELINWSLSDPIMRLDFIVGIAYGSDTALAHKTMLDVSRRHPLVLEQPESTVFFVGFGDNSLNFEVRVFVNESTNTARTRILHDLHMAIDQACRDKDITIAFPQRDLHFKTSEAVLRVAVQQASDED